jgi:ribosomal protein L11 methyltransferase
MVITLKWIENKLTVASGKIDELTALLMSHGIDETQITDEEDNIRFLRDNPDKWDYIDETLSNLAPSKPTVVFYTQHTPQGKEDLAGIRASLSSHGFTDLVSSVQSDDIWLNEWKKYYKPLRVGSIVIRPEWEPFTPKEGDIVLSLNPGGVFGTGLHATTQMCINLLQKYTLPGCEVLDIGSGSGILSIAALLCGAKFVLGCDIDIQAEGNARYNAQLNGIASDRFAALTGNAITDEKIRTMLRARPKPDIVLANIAADAVTGLAPFAKERLNAGGTFIASGIIDERLDDVKCALSGEGFIITDVTRQDVWFAIATRLNPELL